MAKSQQQERKATVEASGKASTDPLVLAAAASVVLSWFEYFGRGNKEMGLFIGLWPPTILAFAGYFQQTKILAQVQSMMPSSIRETVNRMMSSQ